MSNIREWLQGLGLGKYAEVFEENEIDLEAARLLDSEDLKEMGLPIGPRKKILAALPNAAVTAAEVRTEEEPAEAKVSGSGRGAERRRLTVMFCDMVGSTALAEKLDPEDLRALMQTYQQACGTVIARYDGHVAQYLGDGLMVYFGWPAAHEDDAERAVRAGLDMVRAVKSVEAPEPVRVRIGIATGPVVVGETGAGDASVPKLAVGETPNLAARAQGLANADDIVVIESTHREAGSAFVYEDLGERILKGIVEPIRCWRVKGLDKARTQLDETMSEGLTPFVGRERELATLEERLADAEGGQGRVIVLVGEPGVGKSRLLHEFRRRNGSRVAWAEGRAISFGQSMAFHPLIDLLRGNFRIDVDDQPEVVREKVTAGMGRVAADLLPSATYVQYLLGVARDEDPVLRMDPKLRRAEIFDTLRRLLLMAAERRSQVLLFEDLHWSDTATTQFLNELLDSVPASRVLLLVTLRAGFPVPFGERSYITRLTLQNLAPGHAERIAAAVLSAFDIPPELGELVQRKADGNPFFIEELVKSLRETGTLRQEGERWVLNRTLDEIVVPDTVQGVLMSRIDRLEEGPRSALQLAAVIGREFTERLLDRIADLRAGTSDALRALQAVELISQKALYPELAFMFKHALAQDVAYGSLLLQRRRVLHRRVAEAIEKMYADRLGEHAAIIAHHFAAAEQWPKAAEYFDKAADHATAASAVREAISLCDRAIEALDRSNQADAEQRKAVLHQKNAGLYLLVSDFGSAHAEGEKAAAIARLLGDSTGLGSALAGMALASVFGHQFARSLAESNEAIEIGHSIRSDRILAAGRLCVGYVQCVTGNLVDAQTHYEQAYQLSQNTGDAFHQSISTTFLSRLNGWQGNYGPSVARAQEGLEIARRHNLSFPQLVAIWSLSLPQVAKGDYDDAHTTLRETLALTEKLGDEFMRIRALNTLGWLHAECGDIARAVALNEEARVLSSGRGDPETIANAELNLGDAALIQSDPAKAEEFFEHVHKLVGNPATSDWMKWRYSQHLFAGYGETRLARDDPGEAEAWANRCLELASHTNSKKYLVRDWRLKAGVARARLQWDDAEQALLRALEYAREIGNPTQLWKTWIALSEFFRDTQRPDRARAAAVGAREVIERVGLSLKTPVLREAFERSDLIRAVYRSCEAD